LLLLDEVRRGEITEVRLVVFVFAFVFVLDAVGGSWVGGDLVVLGRRRGVCALVQRLRGAV